MKSIKPVSLSAARIYSVLFLLTAGCLMQSCTAGTPETEPPQETVSGTDSAVLPDTALTAEPPRFSEAGGFYDAPFSLSLTAGENAEIYYTLDGSTPTAQSLHYTAPIPVEDRSGEPNNFSARTGIAPETAYPKPEPPRDTVDKATVIRAVAVEPDGSRSETVSQTYFVGFGEKAACYREWKTISLLTDESNLFDEKNGIYVLGKTFSDWRNGSDYDASVPDYFMPANYRQSGREWERRAALQVFENGKLTASQDVGIRIHGGATRSYPQKSLNLYARSEYGASKLECDLFSGAVVSGADGEPVVSFDTVMLRNGGNDAMYTRFRDKLNQKLCGGRAFLTQGMEPCTVFLNGEYWGHYEITEKTDDAFLKSHCGISKKDVCIIKKEALDEGKEETFAEWEQLRKWIRETDFSDSAAYDALCDAVDMQSFADYISCEIYIANANWNASNMAMWKAEVSDADNPFADGKWRFLMFDTDYSTGIYGEVLPTDDSFARLLDRECFLSDLLHAALENDGFRKHFAETFREIADTNFAQERVAAEIEALEKAYHDPAIDTFRRFWSGSFSGSRAEESYLKSVEEVRSFYRERRENILRYLEQYTGEAAED